MRNRKRVAELLAELKAELTTEIENKIVSYCEQMLNPEVDEKWVDVENFNGHYQISNYGRVRSDKRYGQWLLLNPMTNHDGYLLVHLGNGSRKNREEYFVHELVARAFVPNPDNKPEVNHKFGDKKDNRASTLEWVTRRENMQHAVKIGLLKIPKGVEGTNSKLTVEDIKYIRENYKKGDKEFGFRGLAKKFNVVSETIRNVITGKHYQDVK